ncbi:MAG: hypothetical protein OT477_07845 [Chloroflexi bacterium]|nr:hypothetical protein [Chloroflexota bacterium]
MNWKFGFLFTVLVGLVVWGNFPSADIESAPVFGRGNSNAPSQAGDSTAEPSFTVSTPVTPTQSIPARDLPPLEGSELDPVLDREINPRHNPFLLQQGLIPENEQNTADPLLATSLYAGGSTPPVDFTVEGIDNLCGCSPPDTVGDVGPNHYIQMVNATAVGIYTLATNPPTLATPVFSFGDLWSSGPCTGDAGDPIVVYDPLADRWVLSQFYSNGICVAVSQTADPTGSYHLYQFPTPNFPDYFKMAVWPDGYYVSANENSYTALAFDRVNMLAGQAASSIRFAGQTNLLMPSDIDGTTPPPPNSPNYFYTFKDNSEHGGSDRLEVFAFTPNWTTPASSTFTLIHTIPLTSFTYTVCGFFVLNCIPQLGTSQRVDAVSEWPMFRLAYRNFGTHEAMVGAFTVDVGSDRAGIRWFELRDTGAGWALHQEGTFAPSDGLHRFMPSIAMDGQGNIGMGYSVSSSTMNPDLRYTTRLASDPLGTMRPEQIMYVGSGSQTGSDRWGDYSALSVSPSNDCTFWYTSEYYPSNSGNNWNTRIGAFTIPECLGGENFGVQLSADDSQTDLPSTTISYTVQITNTGTTTDTFGLNVTGNGWNTEVSAASVQLVVGQTVGFVVAVDIPAGAMGGEMDTAVVTAVSQGDNSVSDEVNLTTTAANVYDLAWSVDTTSQSGSANEVLTYTFTLTNTGNTTDTYNLDLAGNNWDTAASVPSLTLPANQSANVTVAVTIAGDAVYPEDDIVSVSATSQGDNSVTESVNLTTSVLFEAVYGLSWSVDTISQTGNAGEVVSYTFTLTNTGNTTDTFGVELFGTGWNTVSSEPSLTLGMGESASFIVSVTIDEDATPADDDTVTVVATSSGDNSVSESVMLTTSVTQIGSAIYLPLIMRP